MGAGLGLGVLAIVVTPGLVALPGEGVALKSSPLGNATEAECWGAPVAVEVGPADSAGRSGKVGMVPTSAPGTDELAIPGLSPVGLEATASPLGSGVASPSTADLSAEAIPGGELNEPAPAEASL